MSGESVRSLIDCPPIPGLLLLHRIFPLATVRSESEISRGTSVTLQKAASRMRMKRGSLANVLKRFRASGGSLNGQQLCSELRGWAGLKVYNQAQQI